jgi:hypothetical protein
VPLHHRNTRLRVRRRVQRGRPEEDLVVGGRTYHPNETTTDSQQRRPHDHGDTEPKTMKRMKKSASRRHGVILPVDSSSLMSDPKDMAQLNEKLLEPSLDET